MPHNRNLASRRDALRAIAGVSGAACLGIRSAQAQSFDARVADLAARRTRPLVVLVPTGSEANVAPVAEAFRRSCGLEATLRPVALDDVATVIMLESLSGEHTFDIALPATFSLPDLAAGGAIRPLDDLVDTWEPAGFTDSMLYRNGERVDGRFYGYQTDGDAYLMFYNRQMLEDPAERDAYGTRYGTELALPGTWDELDRQMEFFHRPDRGSFGGLLFRTSTYLSWEWWARFHARGVWPLSPDLTPQIAGDDGVAALEAMIRATAFLTEGGEGLFQNWRRYGEGDIYANIGWGGTQKYLRAHTPMRDRLLHGPLPGGTVEGTSGGIPYFNWGWTYVVSSGCADPELAFAFCLMAVSPELSVQAVRPAEGFFDPFRREHYDDAQIEEAYSRPFLDVHRATLENAIPDLYLPGRARYYQTLSVWIDRALNGAVSPTDAMRHAADEWRLIGLELDTARQAERWRAIRDRYPEPLRSTLRDLT